MGQTVTTTSKLFNFDAAINSYLRNVRAVYASSESKTMTREEEYEMFKQYRECKDNGDEAMAVKLRNEILMKNQLFVFSMAKKYAINEEEILDYVSEATLGMMVAIEKFNPDHEFIGEDGNMTKGLRFISFARNYMRREMQEYMASTKQSIEPSNNAKYRFKKANIKREFLAKYGYNPTEEEVADLMLEKYGEEVKNISDLYEVEIKSIDAAYGDEDEIYGESEEFVDRTCSLNSYDEECENECDDESDYHAVSMILKRLSAENRDIICKYFGIGTGDAYTIDEIAEEYQMYPKDMQKQIDKILKYIKQEAPSIMMVSKAI